MKKHFLLAFALCAAGTLWAQRTPTHPLDITDANWDNLATFFASWTPGTPPTGVSAMDDQFYISRQRPLARISDGDYQVVSGLSTERKFCLWAPLDDPSVTWKSLPRYCFEGDNYSMWSYTDIHGNWTAPWFRSTAGISDAAAKNGTKVGCCLSVPYGESVYLTASTSSSNAKKMYAIMQKDAYGNFIYSDKLARLMKYYGINGVGVNSEFRSTSTYMTQIRNFFNDVKTKAAAIGWTFQVYWYDGTNDTGTISFDNGLSSGNDDNFKMADMFFANYNFMNYLGSGNVESYVTNNMAGSGKSSYDFFCGFDIQGRGLQNYQSGTSNAGWTTLKSHPVSIGFWGAHAQSLIHQSATDAGTSDYAIQNTYLKKQELIFSGGNRNPAYRPAVAASTLANAALTRFHGLSEYITAKSTIQSVPFVSRFNLGNGLSFRNEGQVTFDHKWYNLGTQDYMPTWRWWITGNNDAVSASNYSSLVKADLTFDDAYFGGSCLSLHGATAFSRVKLFKTLLSVEPAYNLSITYKMKGAAASHAKLFVALKNNITTYKEIAIPDGNVDAWSTFTTPLSALGIASGDQIAMMGIVVENAPADYNMLVGEMAVRNPSQTFAPVAPAIKEIQVLRGRYNQVDFKMRYASREESGETKTYNDEVDTWYYEIFFQQKGGQEQLLTATTSWAAYVIDAPITSGYTNREARFGVRAVSPDGVQKSAITWSQYQDIAYDDPIADFQADRPVIKPGEEFTLSYIDEMVLPAQLIKIVDPLTGNIVAQASNSTSITCTIATQGTYDLVVTDNSGTTTTVRGKVQITPEETGAAPVVYSVTANKDEATTGEEVQYTYTSRDGEGNVSKAIHISDPKMIRIPGNILGQEKVYSYAMWFKVDGFSHDKQGTNLINKNSVADGWPTNNWGEFWVQVRPAGKVATNTYNGGANSNVHAANEISFNTFGWETHDLANEYMMSTGYSVTPGVWNHLVVTRDGASQKMYFNGKKVAQTTVTYNKQRSDGTSAGGTRWTISTGTTADVYIGGGGVYKAGLNGYVDEVQVWNKALSDAEVLEAMRGYTEGNIPTGLQGYYTFETLDSDGKYANMGNAGSSYKADVVVMSDSGGENTGSASYTHQSDVESENLGYPGITGTLPITTTHEWIVENGAISSASDKTATVTYATAGKKNVGVKLVNGWSEDTRMMSEIVEIVEGSGVDAVAGEGTLQVFSKSYENDVTVRFAQAGDYEIRIISMQGQVLQSNAVRADAGQMVNVAVNNAGTYVVQVLCGGRQCKAVKVVKK